MTGSVKANLVFLLLILLCAYSRSGGASEAAIRPGRDSAVSELISNVRTAIRYDALQKLTRGFTAEEVSTDASTSKGFVYSLGPGGKARRESASSNPDPFVFDGEDAWQINQTTGEQIGRAHV